MPTATDTYSQINSLISYLVEKGLADEQHYAVLKSAGAHTKHISFANSHHVNIALRNVSYSDIYEQLSTARAYNVKMLDGALIQMMYAFDSEIVRRHRLSFFPAPHLDEFQNNPDIYLSDDLYADVVARNIVPFPVRFDYDIRVDDNAAHDHPACHLTLGQYRNCRIPVTAPLTPFRFVDFILRNFYHTAFVRYAENLPSTGDTFADTIRPRERDIIHVVVPA